MLTYYRLLGTLTHALESSGVDLSQSSISVQINLGKRAVKRPGADGSSSSKVHQRYSYARLEIHFKDTPSAKLE